MRGREKLEIRKWRRTIFVKVLFLAGKKVIKIPRINLKL
jgi:hypothetical protein